MENKELNECLACGSTELYNFVNFGDSMPLANTYPEKSGTKVPTYPLQMFVCGKCTHTQLGIAVDPDLLFKDYLYVSGTTDTLKNHFQAFAQKAIKRAQVSDPHVLDIGCNDGSLMMAFREEGLTHVDGVDPAENLRAERDTKLGYMTIVDYWSLEVARRMEHKFHIITGLNVFAHNSDPLGFLQACKEVLDPLGEIIIEFPYGKNVYLEAQDGQIYHEHISGFNVKSFAALVERAGLGIDEIIESSVHGGSIRFFLRRRVDHCKKTAVYITEEDRQGLADPQTYLNFGKKVRTNYENLELALLAQKALGYKIVGYGAAAKTSTTLNAMKASGEAPDLIEYIVDDNPLKVNRFLAGVDIPIKPVSSIKTEIKPLCIVIFPFNFQQEIKERIKKLRPDRRDISIIYVPKVTLEDIQ
jgi:SAM-dependent methyltransferase